MAESIKTFGWRQPIVVDREGVVVVGHTRLLAAKAIGLAEVPVHVADLSADQARAYRLADNRLGEIAEWDEDLLALELGELKALGTDLGLLGFEEGELEKLLGADERVLVQADEVPEPPATPVSRLGDLWTLGEHRLLCGDSTDASAVARLMAGKKAALFATDPPYLVDYTGADRPSGGHDWSGTYREVEIEDAEGFFGKVFANARTVLRENAAWYCWHAHKRAALIEKVWTGLGVLNHQQIVWVKPASVPTYSVWPWRHEPCLMGWREGHKPRHDGKNAEITSVWALDWEGKARPAGAEHPTQKPIEVFAIPMRKHTRKGEICFEPFSGSGSQLVAGERTGRRVYALELEPTFVDVAIRRWQTLTGERATLDGASYGEVAAARGVEV